MFINRSFFSFIVASLLMLASSDVIAQEAGDALQPAGPISLTGLINGAAEPLSDSEAEATASNGSEAISGCWLNIFFKIFVPDLPDPVMNIISVDWLIE